MDCTPSLACRGLATPVSILLNGTLPLSAMTHAGETISNSCTLTAKSKDTLRDASISCTDSSCLLLHRVFCHWDYANIPELHRFIWSAANTDARVCVRVCVGAFMTQQWTLLQVKSYSEECSLTDVFACHSSFPFSGIRARGRRHADRSSKCFFNFSRPIVTDATMRLRYGLQIVSSMLRPVVRRGMSVVAASWAVIHVHSSNDRLLVNRSSV